jgi:hypothetical protein
VSRKLLLVVSMALLASVPASADSSEWTLGFRSCFDLGSMGIEQDMVVAWECGPYIGLDLVTNLKSLFMFYPGSIESGGLVRSWTYNVDLEPRLEAGWLWQPRHWLSLRAGLDASLLMNFSKYTISSAQYDIDLDWTGFYWILEPALFVSVDLDYGTWFRAKALQGWDLRLGYRIPLRDVNYDYERARLMLSFGWEY